MNINDSKNEQRPCDAIVMLKCQELLKISSIILRN